MTSHPTRHDRERPLWRRFTVSALLLGLAVLAASILTAAALIASSGWT